MTNSVVAIFGPTASGKSAVAVALAQAIDGEIVSADSMQIYRGLERLTNQPTTAEQGGIPHHLVGHVEPTVSYDVSRFAAAAHAGRTPRLTGSSLAIERRLWSAAQASTCARHLQTWSFRRT